MHGERESVVVVEGEWLCALRCRRGRNEKEGTGMVREEKTEGGGNGEYKRDPVASKRGKGLREAERGQGLTWQQGWVRLKGRGQLGEAKRSGAATKLYHTDHHSSFGRGRYS